MKVVKFSFLKTIVIGSGLLLGSSAFGGNTCAEGTTMTPVSYNPALPTIYVALNQEYTCNASNQYIYNTYKIYFDAGFVSVMYEYNGNRAITGSDLDAEILLLTTPPPLDSDANLTAAAGVTEPVNLPSTADTVGEAVDVLDFTLSDGGGGDGVATTISAITVHPSGANTSSIIPKITWRLNGPDVSNVIGTYAAGKLSFSDLNISIADGTSEVYTINAYYSDPTGLTDNTNISLSMDGDTDVTVGSSGTQIGVTTPVTGTTKVDVTATELKFNTQPSNQGGVA